MCALLLRCIFRAHNVRTSPQKSQVARCGDLRLIRRRPPSFTQRRPVVQGLVLAGRGSAETPSGSLMLLSIHSLKRKRGGGASERSARVRMVASVVNFPQPLRFTLECNQYSILVYKNLFVVVRGSRINPRGGHSD